MTSKFKVLIAYDGSAFADAALDDLVAAGIPADDVDAHVISVAEVWIPPETPEGLKFPTAGMRRQHDRHVEEFEETKALAGRAANRLRSKFPSWSVTAEATYGSPAWEILFKAASFAPDLIVVGARGISGLDRVLMGSVSQKVLTEADTSVRIARGKVEVEPGPARIVLAYDGSAGSQAALESLLGRNWPTGSEVKVVIIHDSAHVRSTLDINDEWLNETAESVTAKIDGSGLRTVLVIREGNPKQAIIEEAESWGADCIFAGATGYTGALAKYVIGSVSAAVAQRAHCSVEVVRTNGYKAG